MKTVLRVSLTLLLGMILCLCLGSAAFAEIDSGTWGDNLTWALDDAGTLTISGEGPMDDFSNDPTDAWHSHERDIQSVVISEGVTRIGNNAFESCIFLKRAELPSGLREIGDYAFFSCVRLTDAAIPSSVTRIGSFAFCACAALPSVTLPEGLTELGTAAFRSCGKLEAVTIPGNLRSVSDYAFFDCGVMRKLTISEGVTEIGMDAFARIGVSALALPRSLTRIGSYAFAGCGLLTEVTIPAGVTDIGMCAFSECYALTDFAVDPANRNYSAPSGELLNKGATKLLAFPAGRTGEYTIPAGVTEIGDSAFYACAGLTEITIPAGVAEIGDYAFCACTGLTEITIPAGVTSIGNYAFDTCSGLTEITIPASVTTIGDGAFENIRVQEITIPAGVKSIGRYAFAMNFNMSRIIFRGNAPQIGSNIFFFDSVTAYYPAAADWPSSAFDRYGGSVTWKTYYDALWGDRDLTPDFVLPADLTAIGEEAFRGGAFSTVKLSETTASIGKNAFADAPKLIYIYIPAATADIAPDAFGDRTELTVFGRIGSRAESFAAEHEFTFVPLA